MSEKIDAPSVDGVPGFYLIHDGGEKFRGISPY
jgi:hypothetical protein